MNPPRAATGSSAPAGVENNVFNPDVLANFQFSTATASQQSVFTFGQLRPIAIDGSNVAYEHGKQGASNPNNH